MRARRLIWIFLALLAAPLSAGGALAFARAQARPGLPAVARSLRAPPAAPLRLVLKLRAEPPADFRAGFSGSPSLDMLMRRYAVPTAGLLFDRQGGDPALKRQLGLTRQVLLMLPVGTDGEAARRAFASNPGVEAAALDAWVTSGGYAAGGSSLPDDGGFAEQWSLLNTGQGGGLPGADIDAPQAWDVSTGISATVIAVIDTGIDLDHPDLAGKLLPGWDFVHDDAVPQDDHGHGTHVAGIAAAWGNNGLGIAGVCWACRIMPLKALGSNNDGWVGWWSDALVWAVDHGADVINMSLGTKFNLFFLHDAVRYAYAAGVPVTAAMMNNNAEELQYPAAYTETIAVGATNRFDCRAGFSNYGNHLTLVAPGEAIYSTLWDDGYAAWSGTSMATPHVSGVLGLVHALHPGYPVETLRSILAASADDLVCPGGEDAPGWDPYYGAGRLNADRALALVGRPPVPVPVAAVVIAGPVSGEVGQAYRFTAAVEPLTATQPVVFRWQATGQLPLTDTAGLTSTVQFTWSVAGVQAITVTADNGTGQAQDGHTLLLAAPPTPPTPTSTPPPSPPPRAGFTASPQGGAAPLAVQFTNNSQGDITGSRWDFGDGTGSSAVSPAHTYTHPGSYTVTLTVSGPGGSASAQAQITVQAGVFLPVLVR